MSKKEYIKKLLWQSPASGSLKQSLARKIDEDDFGEEELQKMLIILEKAKERLQKIETGKEKEVLEELDEEKFLQNQTLMAKKMKNIQYLEKKEKNTNQKLLEDLIKQTK